MFLLLFPMSFNSYHLNNKHHNTNSNHNINNNHSINNNQNNNNHKNLKTNIKKYKILKLQLMVGKYIYNYCFKKIE